MATKDTDFVNIKLSVSEVEEVKQAIRARMEYFKREAAFSRYDNDWKKEKENMDNACSLKNIEEYIQECLKSFVNGRENKKLRRCHQCNRLYDPLDSDAEMKEFFCCCACEEGY